MPRINAIDPAAATGAAKTLLDAVHSKFGMTPNSLRTLAVAPAALKGYLDLSSALAGGGLDTRFREQIALTVAQINGCEYCLAAHSAIGAKVGLTSEAIAASRTARSLDAKHDAGLKLSREIVSSRGQVSDSSLLTARAAGLSDAEIIEIVANVALNILTNYFNLLAETVVDFPPVDVAVDVTA